MGSVCSCFRSTCFGGKNETRNLRRQTESKVRLHENGKVSIESFPNIRETFENLPSNYDVPTVIEGNVDSNNDTRRLTTSQSLESLISSSRRTPLYFDNSTSPSSSPMNSTPRRTRLRDGYDEVDEPDTEAFENKSLIWTKCKPVNPKPCSSQTNILISEDTSASRIPPPSTEVATSGAVSSSLDDSRHESAQLDASGAVSARFNDARSSASGAVSARFNPYRQQAQLEMIQRRNPALFAETMECISNLQGDERHSFKGGK